MQHLVEGALYPRPGVETFDAAVFVVMLLHQASHELRHQLVGWLSLHVAIDLRIPAAACVIKREIDEHNLHRQMLPDYLHEYVVRCQQTSMDFTRRPRGGDRGRHAARNGDLARAAYHWRLKQPAYDWRIQRQDLAAPAACLHWTANALADTLDCIEEYAAAWPAEPPAGLEFFPAAELCSAYSLPVGDDQDALLHRIYPDHFRGLLIGHVAELCLDEWERRIAVGPELP